MQNGHAGGSNGHVIIPMSQNGSNQKQSHHPKPLPTDKKRTVAVIGFLGFAWVANDMALGWIHERVPYKTPPLPDIWFMFFPEKTEMIHLTEVLLVTNICIAVLVMLMHKYRWIVLRRVLFITALAYTGRAISITLLQVPVPSVKTYCAPKENQSLALVVRRAAHVITGFGMDSVRGRVLCGDLIYSGHTIVLMITALTVNRYIPSVRRLKFYFGWLSWLSAVAGMICILIARKHYTIDVVMGYIVTTHLFWIYHGMVEQNCMLPSHASMRRVSLANVVWYPGFNYLEHDVKQMFPNIFSVF